MGSIKSVTETLDFIAIGTNQIINSKNYTCSQDTCSASGPINITVTQEFLDTEFLQANNIYGYSVGDEFEFIESGNTITLKKLSSGQYNNLLSVTDSSNDVFDLNWNNLGTKKSVNFKDDDESGNLTIEENNGIITLSSENKFIDNENDYAYESESE